MRLDEAQAPDIGVANHRIKRGGRRDVAQIVNPNPASWRAGSWRVSS